MADDKGRMWRWRSPFTTWVDAGVFATILAMMVCGVLRLPLWTAVMGAVTLSVISWGNDNWTAVVEKSREVDAQWRELAAFAWVQGLHARALWCYLRAHFVWLVGGVHMLHNLFFGLVGYASGWATGWLWGIG